MASGSGLALLGLDDEDGGTAAARLPAGLPDDLADGPTGPHAAGKPARRVPHGPRVGRRDSRPHLPRVGSTSAGARRPDLWRAQMAVLVRANGRLGRAHMAFINPFRHLIVYPAMPRNMERQWARRDGTS